MDMQDEFKGIDKETGCNRRGQTKAHLAAFYDDPRMLSELIASGADMLAKDNAGHTPLMTAAMVGSPGCVDAIAERQIHGAREADFDGWTALMHAALNNREEIVEKLMAVSNSQAVNENGQKASDVARDSGFPALATKMEDLAREKFKRDLVGYAARTAALQALYSQKEEPMGM